MKKLLAFVVLGALVLSLAACGAQQPAASQPAEAQSAADVSAAPASDAPAAGVPAAAALKVALLIPGPPTDGAWCQGGAEALQAVQEDMGFKLSIVEAATADVMKSEAEALADDGYNFVFGHGGQYATPFAEIADEYPDTMFVTMGGAEIKDNLFPMLSTLEQLTYVQGAIAAKLSETGKMGLVLGGSFPAYTKTSRAFELGAKSVNPDAEVMITILTNVDLNEAYESTLSQINAGADVIWANANQATYGSLKAAQEKGVYYFGAPSNMNADAPEIVVCSVTQDFHKTYAAVVQRYLDGTIKPEAQSIGLAEDAIAFVWNEELKATLPEDVQNTYDELAPKLISGEIHVPGELE